MLASWDEEASETIIGMETTSTTSQPLRFTHPRGLSLVQDARVSERDVSLCESLAVKTDAALYARARVMYCTGLCTKAGPKQGPIRTGLMVVLVTAQESSEGYFARFSTPPSRLSQRACNDCDAAPLV